MPGKDQDTSLIPRKRAFSERAVNDRERPDLRRIELAVQSPPTIRDMIREAISQHLSMQANDQQKESFVEADDFNLDDDLDDLDWTSRYQLVELRPEGADYDLDGTDREAPLTEDETSLAHKLERSESSAGSRNLEVRSDHAEDQNSSST